jgi:hypothetical protein
MKIPTFREARIVIREVYLKQASSLATRSLKVNQISKRTTARLILSKGKTQLMKLINRSFKVTLIKMTNFSTRGIRDLPIPASLSQLTSVKN